MILKAVFHLMIDLTLALLSRLIFAGLWGYALAVFIIIYVPPLTLMPLAIWFDPLITYFIGLILWVGILCYQTYWVK